MPVNQRYDFLLSRTGDRQRGFMIQRPETGLSGRAWDVTGVVDSPIAGMSPSDQKYGNINAQIDHPSVWDDWSGGFGAAYRRASNPNTVHWAENMDLRRPGEAIHVQALRIPTGVHASWNMNAEYMLDVPQGIGTNDQVVGGGEVLAYGLNFITRYSPTNLASEASQLLATVEGTGGNWSGRAALYGSYIYIGQSNGSAFARIDADGGGFTMGTLPGAMFVTAGQQLWRLWGPGTKGPVYAQNINDINPANILVSANWSATYNVGGRGLPIRDVVALGNQLFLGTPDGLYAGDLSGTFSNVLGELGNAVNLDNARNIVVHEGQVMVPYLGGIYAYRPSTTTPIAREIWSGPMQSNRSPIRGQVTAVESLGPYLYAGLWTGSQSYILAGWDASYPLPYAWTPMHKIPARSRINRIHFDSITAPSGGVPSGIAMSPRMWVSIANAPAVTANAFTNWNPSDKNANVTLSGGNFIASSAGSGAAWYGVRSALGKSSGKWYWEITGTGGNGWSVCMAIGVGSGTQSLAPGSYSSPANPGFEGLEGRRVFFSGDSDLYHPVFDYSTGTFDYTDVIGVALDMDAGTVTFYKNGVSLGASITGLTGTVYAYVCMNGLNAIVKAVANFGQSVFVYSVPTGFNAGLFVAGSGETPGALYYAQVPVGNDSPLSDLSFSANYNGSAIIAMGADDWDSPGTKKVMRSFEIGSEKVASGIRYADLYYSVDGAAMALAGAVATGPSQVINMPTNVFGQSIATELRSFSATVNNTPIWRSIVGRGAIRAKTTKVITAQVRIADEMTDRQGQTMDSAAAQLKALNDFANPNTAAVTLIDLAGATQYVSVLPPIKENEVWQDGQQNPELTAIVTMAVLDYSGS